jgi:DNA polymerase family A
VREINNVITLDVETYYGPGCSLSTLTPLEYVNHPDFEFICGTIHDAETGLLHRCVGIDAFSNVFSDLAHGKGVCVVSHNIRFDARVLARFGLLPPHATYACTMSMMRAAGWHKVGGASLNNLAAVLRSKGVSVPEKGTEVIKAYGMTLRHMQERGFIDDYVEYCATDTTICAAGFNALLPLVQGDMLWQHLVHLCDIEPKFQLNKQVLENELERLKTVRAMSIMRAAQEMDVPVEQAGTMLRSSEKFATLLKQYGVEPPMKMSPKTGKPTYAFAKTDAGMQDLLENGPDAVQMLCAERLASKSVGALARAERFLNIHKLTGGALPVPLLVSGAHTHRCAGADSVNLQSLPSGRTAGQTKALRQAIVPPPGLHILAADAKQIELRLLAFTANDSVSLNEILNNMDPYIATGCIINDLEYDRVWAAYKSDDKEQVAWANFIRTAGKSARLGLGFRAGPIGYTHYCKNVMRMPMDINTAGLHVHAYRRAYPAVPAMWDKCDDVIKQMAWLVSSAPISEYDVQPDVPIDDFAFGGPTGKLLGVGVSMVHGHRVPFVQLPTGLRLWYPGLHYHKDVDDKGMYMYYPTMHPDGTPARGMAKMHGGILTENIIQALGSQYLGYVGVEIYKQTGRAFGLVVHDELAYTTPADDTYFEAVVAKKFTTPPEWLKGCPLGVDIDKGENYGF